ncbi:DNA-binding HxlR family transcriptional regulator [Neorhizobium galegae]|uniref:winged helix-turn-helix transcriptional regulator n=1 Tax=Neorhizobium galegae TaxID=399 RepID=UPI001FDA2552|nr:helix-turn-helix domain-containing protein [Neorhizobium galegae]MBP2551814.1 DNA-binding HxlR family transcriptional regulator [Neorhizobium galegae]
MKPSYVELMIEGDCAEVGGILSRVGDKWSVLVVVALADRPLHFNELKRLIDAVSAKVLTSTLKALVRDGFIIRHEISAMPTRVSYELTPLGRDLLTVVRDLALWSVRNRFAIREARKTYDASTPPARRLIKAV